MDSAICVCPLPGSPEPIAVRMPAAIAGAPNRIKHPMTMRTPRRLSMWPDNIMRPKVATASTAAMVAEEPRSAPCSQARELTKEEPSSMMQNAN